MHTSHFVSVAAASALSLGAQRGAPGRARGEPARRPYRVMGIARGRDGRRRSAEHQLADNQAPALGNTRSSSCERTARSYGLWMNPASPSRIRSRTESRSLL